MLINTVSRTLPHKSVVWDVVSRDGPPGPDNYPVEGIASKIMDKIHGLPYTDLMRFLQDNVSDFDYSRSVKNSLSVSSFNEVSSQRIMEYVEQLTYGYRRNELNGYREYMNNHLAVQRAVRNKEDSRVYTESDIATDDSDEAKREILEIKQKIPYLLKQLHIRSKQIGISLISMVIANEKVKAKFPDKSSKPVKLVEEGVYYMDSSGHITSKMTHVAGTFPFLLHLWVNGEEGHYDIYYAATVELLGYCERIGVDLTLEDATKYQEEFIHSLPFDHIIRNEELPLAVVSQKSRQSKEALFKLRGVTIDDFAQSDRTVQIDLDVSGISTGRPAVPALMTKTMSIFLNRAELRQFIQTDEEQYKALIQLSIAFDRLGMGHIIEKGMFRNDGFYMDRYGKAITKNIACLGAGGGGVTVIFHDTGYAILVPSSDEYLHSVKCTAFAILTKSLRDYAISNKEMVVLDWESL